MALQTVLASTAIAGADGLAFLGSTLVVNDVATGALFAIELDGATMLDFEFLSLSRPLEGPDGMRTSNSGNGLWVAENDAGRISYITVDGNSATIETIAEAEWASATSMAEVGDTLYVVDTNFPALGSEDAATLPFFAHAVSSGM